ncbi:hemicentin-2-like [Dermacentor silvarum]|uniref:hemicentin-2-like n=1 Tax=Dermacentor silvarum TaxID=543639 RepID=UPI002100919B|nr:hemicentin-2-like [Dermacentor silvarum]
MDGCVPVLLALWAYATLSEEAVPLTEGEAEAKKKADSVEALTTIKCLSRRPASALEEEQIGDSQEGVKSRDKAGGEDDAGEASQQGSNNVMEELSRRWSPTRHVPVPSYSVVAREGDELQLSCGSAGADSWLEPDGTSSSRTTTEAVAEPRRKPTTFRPVGPDLRGRLLRFGRVRRQHSRRYTCRFKSARGYHILVDVQLVVQYAPSVEPLEVLRDKKDSRLVCVAGAEPSPEIAWLRDDQPLSQDISPSLRTENASQGCLRISKLHLREVQDEAEVPHNYTCVASNTLGTSSRSLLLRNGDSSASPNASVVRDRDPLDGVPVKRFKITGFVIGMLPPLFISFYIILKLGYRSRYAEERAEEAGMMEEPFFISY